MRRVVIAVLFVLVAVPTPALAASNEPNVARPEIGDRVRIVAPTVHKGRLAGTLTALDESTLTVTAEQDGRNVEVPRAAVTELLVQRGKKRSTAKGALIGALAGAALMAFYFAGENDMSDNSGTSDVIGGLAFFFLPPTAVGAAVGTAIKQDRWVGAPPQEVTRTARRLVVGVTVRF